MFTDEFDTTLSSDWNQIAGSWSTSAGELVTSSDDALIVHDTAQVSANKGRISADGGSVTGLPFSLIAYSDSSNYAYIKFSAPSAGYTAFTLRLGHFIAGAETFVEQPVDGFYSVTDETYTLCWDGVRLVGGKGNKTLNLDYTAPDNLRPGFATGTGTSWNFSHIELWDHIEARSSCPWCGTCWDVCETYPETMEVYIPAGTFTNPDLTLAATGWACAAGCDALNNQTFMLTKTADGDIGFSDYDADTDVLWFARTGCPLYEYTEDNFCDIESDDFAGSYAAKLTIWARFLVNADGGGGGIQVNINIRSDCEAAPADCGTVDSYGNRTSYQFYVPPPPLAKWGACAAGEYETDALGTESYQACESRYVPPDFPFPGFCTTSAVACDVDNTKTLTVTL